jgi:hypothetical protein
MLSLHRLSFFTNFLDDQSNINQQKLKNSPMKTDQLNHPAAVFLQTVSAAIAQLKQQLQRNYEQDYPGLREIVHLVLDEEETKAWELSLFPHLLLPDLVEAHIEKPQSSAGRHATRGPADAATLPRNRQSSTRFRSMWITRIGK